MNYTIKQLAQHHNLVPRTLHRWHGDTKKKKLVQLAMLSLFVEKTGMDYTCIKALAQLLCLREDSAKKAEAYKAKEKFEKVFPKAKHFALAAELYSLGILEKEELRLIHELRRRRRRKK